MKDAGAASGDYHRMQVWSGQSAAMAEPIPAGELVRRLWNGAEEILGL
jgi:nitronate monooxygenase